MTAAKITSGKITRPTPAEVVERKRLFTLLDGMFRKPVTWVTAPGGSGKSTLVASYLDVREIPCIWYQCDEGDADLATFFYYMGLAATKFEILFNRCKIILLDNYQDVPANSPFHDMIATGFDGIPEDAYVVVISRGEPPAASARLQANNKIDLLQCRVIRLPLTNHGNHSWTYSVRKGESNAGNKLLSHGYCDITVRPAGITSARTVLHLIGMEG